MKRLFVIVPLLLAATTVVAAPPGPPPGPPIEKIAAQMNLDSTQTAEVKRIMEQARARMDDAARESMAQADVELANVLTGDQIKEFKQLMQASRPHGRLPGSPPPSNDQ